MILPKMRNMLTLLFVAFLSALPPQFVLGLPVVGEVQTLHTSGDGKFKFPMRISLTEAAASNGAVCLDGRPPTYYYHPGSGKGERNWIIYHEGGGWCFDIKSCAERAKSTLGSTAMDEAINLVQANWFSGMLSQNPNSNSDFHNWNLVYVRYCDGASFSGDVDHGVEVSARGAKIYFRGQRIWEAVMADLLGKRGMHLAEMALLAGCSAGGLTTMIHCDQFRAVMPKTTLVKCMSDAGFFLNQRNVEGDSILRGHFASIVSLQNLTGTLHPDCTTQRKPSQLWQCFFPQYFIQFLKTPLYIVNSGYDSWQIANSLIPIDDWRSGPWKDCYSTFNFSSCSEYQLASIIRFWKSIAYTIEWLLSTFLENGNGAYIFSCRVHCIAQDHWTSGIQVNNLTPAKAFGDWYFGRHGTSPVVHVDRFLPTNASC